MPSWLLPGSHRAQLALTAVGTGAVVACSILAAQKRRKQSEVKKLRDAAKSIGLTGHDWDRLAVQMSDESAPSPLSEEDVLAQRRALRARAGDYDEDLILEQLARNRVFLGDDGLSTVRSSFVIVVGVGGVGSHAAASLVRSGIGAVRLIDFDQVTLSSLNRHAVATLSDVGSSKVETMRRRLEQIAPWVQFDCRAEMFSADTAEALLAPWNLPAPDAAASNASSSSSVTLPSFGKPAYVIDAIDNVETKIALLRYCHQHGLPVVSSMGAGCKSDPTRIFVGDISASSEDPLSRSIRTKLRLLGVSKGIPTVFSTEKSGPNKAQLQPIPEDAFEAIKAQQQSQETSGTTKSSASPLPSSTSLPPADVSASKSQINELAVLPDFRVRILPVLGTMPAIFGLTLANHVILTLTGYPHEPIRAKTREKLYESALNLLQSTEQSLAKAFYLQEEDEKKTEGADVVVVEESGQREVRPDTATAGKAEQAENGKKRQEVLAGLKLALTTDDAGYLIDEIFRGHSVVSGLTSRLALVRWRPPVHPVATSLPSSSFSASPTTAAKGYLDLSVPNQKLSTLKLDEVVLMTKEEVTLHVRTVLQPGVAPEGVYSPETVALVEKRRKEMLANMELR